MDLQQRWRDLWARHSSDKELGEHILTDMISKYSQMHRHYHTLVHVSSMLIQFDYIQNLLKYPDKVEFAIWFHDVIYAIGVPIKKNEQDSAEYAFHWLTKGGVDEKFAMDVHEHIIGTNHTQKPSNKDTQYLADLDLLSLAGDYKDFKRRGKDVRAESPKSDMDYWKATSGFFQFLMSRGRVFWTEYFYKKHEKEARKNMLIFIKEKPN